MDLTEVHWNLVGLLGEMTLPDLLATKTIDVVSDMRVAV